MSQEVKTYRYIRFVKEPVARRGGLQDIIKVFFDIDDYPQNYFTESQFLEFMVNSGHVEEGSPQYRQLKNLIRTYGIHYVFDTKEREVINTGLEPAPEETQSLRQTMDTMLQERGTFSQRRRGQNHNIHECLQKMHSYVERIGSHSLN